jgi:hypothetical protein
LCRIKNNCNEPKNTEGGNVVIIITISNSFKTNMAQKSQADIIAELQNNADVVILNNPLAAPKLVRRLGRKREVQPSEIYLPKLFYDIISRITPDHLQQFEEGKTTVSLTLNIKEFLDNSSGSNSKSLYKHVIDCIEELQTTLIKWSDDASDYGSSIITYSKHIRGTGKVEIVLYKEFVKRIVEVTQNEHFSFLKLHLFQLQNAQAIKLFPYFVSWRNRGEVEIGLENFKNKFSYNTGGYLFFNNLKNKVLEPALNEINEKTELIVSYELIGENLGGQRPRVKALRFFIAEKGKKKLPTKAVEKEKTVVAEPEANPALLHYYDMVADFWGVDKTIFFRYAEGKTNEAINRAIEFTKTQVRTGKATRPAAVFIDALKNNYQAAEDIQKEARQKKAQAAAETKATLEAQLKPLETELAALEKNYNSEKDSVIAAIVTAVPDASEKVLAQLKIEQPLFFDGKTLEDCRQSVMLRTIVKGAFERFYAPDFVPTKQAFEPRLQNLRSQIRQLKGE